MTRRTLLIVTPAAMLAWAQTQPGEHGAIDTSDKVELKGTIERVQASPGQGMPFLMLKSEKNVERVMLGSMRYLMENNFNPKAGSLAIVKGFRMNGTIYGQSISLPAEKVQLKLRDDAGVPLWRMGRYGWKQP